MNQQRDSKSIKTELHQAIKQNGIHWETVERLLKELRSSEKAEKLKKRGGER